MSFTRRDGRTSYTTQRINFSRALMQKPCAALEIAANSSGLAVSVWGADSETLLARGRCRDERKVTSNRYSEHKR
jgi:hypothetical protein